MIYAFSNYDHTFCLAFWIPISKSYISHCSFFELNISLKCLNAPLSYTSYWMEGQQKGLLSVNQVYLQYKQRLFIDFSHVDRAFFFSWHVLMKIGELILNGIICGHKTYHMEINGPLMFGFFQCHYYGNNYPKNVRQMDLSNCHGWSDRDALHS